MSAALWCSRCGDGLAVGTMNASGIELTHEGLVCGTCMLNTPGEAERYVSIADDGTIATAVVPCADEDEMVTRGDKVAAALLCVPDATLWEMLLPWMPAEGDA